MAITHAFDKLPPGPKLDTLTAQKMFGWKNVHQDKGSLVGKKPDKLGRWRTTRVPSYSTNPVYAYAIDERMKQLGRSEKYAKELSRIATVKKITSEWASPDQRCRAAISAVGK